jgi:hypothetical protein
MVKAGTTPNLRLHNNTKGVTSELNQTFYSECDKRTQFVYHTTIIIFN